MAGDLAAFRAEVRDWLAANLTDELREVAAKSTSVFVDKPHTFKWQAILHKKGWVAPTWPKGFVKANARAGALRD
jgi:acyl-CoA dehydrogenase